MGVLEVEGHFRRQRERGRRAEQRLEPLADQAVQLRASHVGQPAVDRLPVQRVVEFVIGRQRPVCQLPHSRRPHEQPSLGEPLARALDAVDVRCRAGDGPRRKAFPDGAGPPQRLLLGVRESIELHVEHVLE